MAHALHTTPPDIAASALAELKAHLGLVQAENDAALSGYLRSALSLCEAFTGQTLLQRQIRQKLTRSHSPQRLKCAPVIAITAVHVSNSESQKQALPAASYSVDIDGAALGRVTLTGPLPVLTAGSFIEAQYLAGLAAQWTYLPEAIRHGIIMLAAHFYDQPRTALSGPPAAVAALWRPWRVMRLA